MFLLFSVTLGAPESYLLYRARYALKMRFRQTLRSHPTRRTVLFSLVPLATLADVPEQLKAEIQHFFERYKDLEPGKWVKGEGWDDLPAAEKMVQEAIDRFAAECH